MVFYRDMKQILTQSISNWLKREQLSRNKKNPYWITKIN